MKKYIILTRNICDMGGGQQYCTNKANWMRAFGYDVFVFSADRGNVIIESLKPFYRILQPITRFKPGLYCSSLIEKVLSRMAKIVGNNDDSVLIESNGVVQAQWGELLANKLGGKHICIDLQEQHTYSNSEVAFLYHKYKRKEYFGINRKTVKQVFGQLYTIGENEEACVDPICTNVVQNVDCDMINEMPSSDYIVCSIGRLDKPFVKDSMKEFAVFAKKKSDKSFILILLGGGSNSIISEIRNIFSSVYNVKLVVTGYLFPIPLRLIMGVDCFFSSAGSANVSMIFGRPTISISADTGRPLGILNYTTKSVLYKDIEVDKISENKICNLTLSDYLDMILFQDFCKKNPSLGLENEQPNMEQEFKRQLNLFFRENNELVYYDVKTIKPGSKKEKIYKIFSFIIGGRLFEKNQYYLSVLKEFFHHKRIQVRR